MRSSRVILPIAEAEKAYHLFYDLKVVQEPKNTLESTLRRDEFTCHTKLHKRLVNPHAIIVLKVYSGSIDITGRVLSLFFLKVKSNKDSILVGTRVVSGSLLNLPSIEPVIIFKIDNLGLLEEGQYSLKFELFKFEGYNYLSSIPSLMKVTDTKSYSITVYKARDYYKPRTQTKVVNQVSNELKRASKNPVMQHLTNFGLVKKDEAGDKKQQNLLANKKPKLSKLANHQLDDTLAINKIKEPQFIQDFFCWDIPSNPAFDSSFLASKTNLESEYFEVFGIFQSTDNTGLRWWNSSMEKKFLEIPNDS